MKTRKLMRGITLALMLILVLALLVACGGDGAETTGAPDTTGAPTTDAPTVKASDYALVYAATADTATTDAAGKISDAVTEKLGTALKSVGAESDSFDPNAYEILVGATNRAESATALEALGGKNGYVVSKIGSKIVVNATSTALLDDAAAYFVAEYVEKGTDGTFAAPAKNVFAQETASSVTLLSAPGKTDYIFVVGANVDTTSNPDTSGADMDRTDYVVQYFLRLRTEINSALGVSIDTRTDSVSVASDSPEILLGRTSRPETAVFLSTLAPNQYGYAVIGNKLVITGWSDYTIGKAVDQFITDMGSFISEDGGFKNFVMEEASNKVFTYSLWNVDIPLYSGGKLDGVVEGEFDSYELYYPETTKEEYDAYCASLTAQGYKLAQNNVIGENYYATYTNGSMMIHVYFLKYQQSVRMIAESHKYAILPQLTDPYEKITETKLTIVDLENGGAAYGNCFVVTLEDGSFIVHDGGNNVNDTDDEEIWNLLNRINERPDGKVVIAAWILSHEHGDHFKGFLKTLKTNSANLVLEKIVYNVPMESFDYNTGNPTRTLRSGEFATMKLRTGCELVRMHTGQKIQIRNLTIEVLYTWEDIYPEAPHHFNNSAFVTRFDIGEGENKQRVTFLGDIEDVGSNILAAMYGEYLKTDILQVAHHGYGGTVELYALFEPTVVFWPLTQAGVNTQLKPSQTGYYPTINKSLCNQPNVLLLVVADGGHKVIPLPLTGLTEDETANATLITVLPRDDGNE